MKPSTDPNFQTGHLPAAHREVSELKAPRQGRVRRPQARFFPGTGALRVYPFFWAIRTETI